MSHATGPHPQPFSQGEKGTRCRLSSGTTFHIRCLTSQLLDPNDTGKTRGARMFTNLIESQSHRQEFKRRSSFFLFTVAAYAVILFGAGIGSIYAYDAQLDAQASDLELMSWVPPVTPAVPKLIADPLRPRRPAVSTAPVDRNVTQSVRTHA